MINHIRNFIATRKEHKEIETIYLNKRSLERYKVAKDLQVTAMFKNDKREFAGRVLELSRETFTVAMDSGQDFFWGETLNAIISLYHYRVELEVKVMRSWEQNSIHCGAFEIFSSDDKPPQEYLKIVVPLIIGYSLNETRSFSNERMFVGAEKSRLLIEGWGEGNSHPASFELKALDFTLRGTAQEKSIVVFVNGSGVANEEKRQEAMEFFNLAILNLSESIPDNVKTFLKDFVDAQNKEN